MIKSEIPNTTGMVWSDEWKAPEDKGNYKYKIFSTLSGARAWTSVILAGKRDSRRHSTTSFRKNVVVTEISFQMLEVQSFGNHERAD